ncbi:WD-40 repeat protein [Reticulomyxa filosa]|uniref:WD-40 repeat protein n=1 Tax=Reticulomyxa filosa TaxID=46433 RepID=X6P6P4_RETFI|nr:WD-40 repeat protein [Reticulomyxa filosa]|eukprot:ETO34210.1 WD-40 repeat protein [Reticulomyxa filosa]
MVVDICVLDLMTKLFVCGMLKNPVYCTFSMGIQVLFGVLTFHHCKATTGMIIKVTILVYLAVTDIQSVLDHLIKPFEYGILKQLNNWVYSKDMIVGNTILSGSDDKSVRLWDIRSDEQIQVFNGHTNWVWAVEYSPFVIKNTDGVGGNSNVICSGSLDNTIRFWDIRSNKSELYVIKVYEEIACLKFIELKKNSNNNEKKVNDDICVNLCYGSNKRWICVWG